MGKAVRRLALKSLGLSLFMAAGMLPRVLWADLNLPVLTRALAKNDPGATLRVLARATEELEAVAAEHTPNLALPPALKERREALLSLRSMVRQHLDRIAKYRVDNTEAPADRLAALEKGLEWLLHPGWQNLRTPKDLADLSLFTELTSRHRDARVRELSLEAFKRAVFKRLQVDPLWLKSLTEAALRPNESPELREIAIHSIGAMGMLEVSVYEAMTEVLHSVTEESGEEDGQHQLLAVILTLFTFEGFAPDVEPRPKDLGGVLSLKEYGGPAALARLHGIFRKLLGHSEPMIRALAAIAWIDTGGRDRRASQLLLEQFETHQMSHTLFEPAFSAMVRHSDTPWAGFAERLLEDPTYADLAREILAHSGFSPTTNLLSHITEVMEDEPIEGASAVKYWDYAETILAKSGIPRLMPNDLREPELLAALENDSLSVPLRVVVLRLLETSLRVSESTINTLRRIAEKNEGGKARRQLSFLAIQSLIRYGMRGEALWGLMLKHPYLHPARLDKNKQPHHTSLLAESLAASARANPELFVDLLESCNSRSHARRWIAIRTVFEIRAGKPVEWEATAEERGLVNRLARLLSHTGSLPLPAISETIRTLAYSGTRSSVVLIALEKLLRDPKWREAALVALSRLGIFSETVFELWSRQAAETGTETSSSPARQLAMFVRMHPESRPLLEERARLTVEAGEKAFYESVLETTKAAAGPSCPEAVVRGQEE